VHQGVYATFSGVPDRQAKLWAVVLRAVVHYSHAVDRQRHPTLQPPRTRVDDTILDLTQVSASFDEAFDWLCRGVGHSLTTPRQLRAALQSRPRARQRSSPEAARDMSTTFTRQRS
jgi:hypothetical protein